MDSNEINSQTNLMFKEILGDWIPKNVVQKFFNYGNTKMSTFASDNNVRVSKVGKRIFYKYSDIVDLINRGLQ